MLSFNVKNLGKIKDADITTAPLTIFVGQNNTGKSYAANILWALSNLDSFDEAILPDWYREFMQVCSKKKNGALKIDREKAEEVIDVVNKFFAADAGSFLSRVFSYDGFDNTIFQFRLSDDFEEHTATITFSETQQALDKVKLVQGSIQNAQGSAILRLRFPQRSPTVFRTMCLRLFKEIIGFCLHGNSWQYYRNPLYIPAARTGLFLAMRALVSNLFEEIDEEVAPKFPLPLGEFLQRLAWPATERKTPHADIARWLETNILKGTIKASDDPVPSYSYYAEGDDRAVPMHAASSMITELAPLSILLKGRMLNSHIILEEPEAHLHLSAQRYMARAIARLVNAGMRVTLTTHSDTFVQQLNNLMTLYTRQDEASLIAESGYDTTDLINPLCVKAYEFQPVNGGTAVVELQRLTEGFAVPSLNDTLLNLAEETVSLMGS